MLSLRLRCNVVSHKNNNNNHAFVYCRMIDVFWKIVVKYCQTRRSPKTPLCRRWSLWAVVRQSSSAICPNRSLRCENAKLGSCLMNFKMHSQRSEINFNVNIDAIDATTTNEFCFLFVVVIVFERCRWSIESIVGQDWIQYGKTTLRNNTLSFSCLFSR